MTDERRLSEVVVFCLEKWKLLPFFL